MFDCSRYDYFVQQQSHQLSNLYLKIYHRIRLRGNVIPRVINTIARSVRSEAVFETDTDIGDAVAYIRDCDDIKAIQATGRGEIWVQPLPPCAYCMHVPMKFALQAVICGGRIGPGGGWRVMYTLVRGVEVGKWPAKRARRPRDLELAISIRGRPSARGRPSPRTRLTAAAGGWRRATKTLLCLSLSYRPSNREG